VISFDEASELTRSLVRPVGREELALADASGRVLAADVLARIDSPRANVSAMDGYAVRESEAGQGATLPIAGRSYPGQPFGAPLPPGACVRVFTGGAVPDGADRVVIQEDVAEAAGRASFREDPRGAAFIRRRATDFAAGDRLLRVGQRLTPGALLAAGGGDVGTVSVWRRPGVGLLATGDELVAPGEAAAQPSAIPDSVSAALAALVHRSGGEMAGMRRLGDDLEASVRAAGELAAASDIIVITGGASVGEKDFAKAIFAAIGGRLLFSKVAMKPGKPVWAGDVGGMPVLGVPGNPTSALVTARLFLVPLLSAMGGAAFDEALRFRLLPAAEDIADVGDRETFLRGHDLGDRVSLADHQDSNGQRTPATADLLVRVAPGLGTIAAGTPLPVLSL